MKRLYGPVLALSALLLVSGFGCISVNGGKTVGHVDGRLMKNRPDGLMTLYAVGKGLAPETAVNRAQADFLAERAAIADGYRQLVEKIHGVYVDSYQRSGAGMVDYEYIYLETRAWIQGAEVIEIKEGNYGSVEAHMRVSLQVPNTMRSQASLARPAVGGTR